MSPSALTTPTGAQETSWAHHSNGILDVHSDFGDLHVSPPLNYTPNGHGNTPSPSQSPSTSTTTTRTASSTSSTAGDHLNDDTTNSDSILDLILIGFGPASLAIAISLHDTYTENPSQQPTFLALEKQSSFGWHSGMQLPGAKMQISFLKDLATPRSPRSHFTFLNYLHQVGRFNHFINLGTFLPSRKEYELYLRWCAGFFEREKCVKYGVDVERVSINERTPEGKVSSFVVVGTDGEGRPVRRRAKRVVIAVGGKPRIPDVLKGVKSVCHSSQFALKIPEIEARQKLTLNGSRGEEEVKKLRFAVIGSGQSAAEIFNDIWDRFPDAEVKLIIKGASLRPSDDSPFVNEIFDPERVSQIYTQAPPLRASAITLDRSTNYGVVRLSLLEHIYEKLYLQRLTHASESQWRCSILPGKEVISTTNEAQVKGKEPGVGLVLRDVNSGRQEILDVDYVIAATGYVRDSHLEMLEGLSGLLPEGKSEKGVVPVARDYRVLYDEHKVDFGGSGAGVWLQGCNEGTHGLSDTLLSILAVRGGEIVESMFGKSTT